MSTSAPPVLPETTPAWWIHYLNLVVSVAAFVGVAVHPGWHPPALLAEVIGPLALVLAIGSGLTFAVLRHKAGQTTAVTAGLAYLRTTGSDLTAVAAELAPVLAHDPALERRVRRLEETPAVSVLPNEVKRLLQALSPGWRASGPLNAPGPSPVNVGADQGAPAVAVAVAVDPSPTVGAY